VKQEIAFIVNDFPQRVEVEPTRLLIDVLRDDLHLKGTKEGCSIGVCGACTVLVDDEVMSACITLAVSVRGKRIRTIEGIASGGELHPLQRAFLDYGGFQCGFCTPGQILAAYALLGQHPDPSDDEIKEAMLGNLCRCTGYYKIIDSIKAAAVVMRQVASPLAGAAGKTVPSPLAGQG
jgi:aerobic carbon-monoxide dehydrogenase small subunit